MLAALWYGRKWRGRGLHHLTHGAEMPEEIMAWPADVTPAGEVALTGWWGASRHYTDDAVRYVRKDDQSS